MYFWINYSKYLSHINNYFKNSIYKLIVNEMKINYINNNLKKINFNILSI